MQEAIIFVRQGGEVFGYERMEQVPAGMAVMSPEEVAEHLNPSQTLSELADAAMAQVNAEYIKRMGAVASLYPLHERESWPIQLAEAQTVLAYQGGELPEGVTSTWIDQCAHQRGMTRLELAQRIVAKDMAYRTVSGFLSGVRQWHEGCIAMLLQDGEDAREALQAYDHLQGWEQSAPV